MGSSLLSFFDEYDLIIYKRFDSRLKDGLLFCDKSCDIVTLKDFLSTMSP